MSRLAVLGQIEPC